MFKKSKIAMAVTAASIGAIGAVNTAQAVNVNPDGKGQVLILPYYNVNNNFITSFNLTNTTNKFKAVKIRFRGSKKSHDVLDFNVYMSPEDQWAATIRMNPDNGKSNIITEDETCTYPDKSLLQAGVDFIDVYTNVTVADVTEGYVEIYDMGDIADGPGPAVDQGLYAEISANGILGDGDTGAGDVIIVDGLEHDSNGLPPDCGVVFDAWAAPAIDGGFTRGDLVNGVAAEAVATNPYDADQLNNGLVAPSGGLSAFEIMINLTTGAAFVVEAQPISNYSTLPQHYESDDIDYYLLPSLASGNIQTSNMLDASGNGLKNATWPLTYFDTGALDDIDPNDPRPAGANPFPIAAVLSVTGLSNDYYINPDDSGSTDHVVMFPMRKHGIWNGYYVDDQVDTSLPACVPGTVNSFDRWPSDGSGNLCTNAAYVPNAIDDVVVTIQYWDREEQEVTPTPGEPGFSPPLEEDPVAVILEREVNVITYAREGEEPDSVLGTPEENRIVLTLNEGWITGWARYTMGDAAIGVNYNWNGTGNAIDDLVDPRQDGSNAGFNQTGVPTGGFGALEAEVGPASVGETVQHVRYVNR